MSALSLEDRARIEMDRDDELTGATGASPVNAPTHQLISKPVMVDSAGLLAATFPPRERLLSPWLLSQSLSMIYAPRGVGKTHVALGIAYALASAGGFLGWTAAKPVRVAYLDGEMPGADLQQRVRRIEESADHRAHPGHLKFMTPDLQPNGIMPNLYSPIGQRQVTDAAGDAQVIVVDNLSALVRGGKENEGESWQPVAEWALRMRASGRSVVFIHHAGKGGQQRGTSKREDLLDAVLSLRRPSDYTPEQGARFEIHFEKARALYGEDTAAMEASLITGPDGRQDWAMRQVADASEEQMIELAELGLSSREIGGELGVNHSTVVRGLRKAEKEGRYTPKAKSKGGRPKLSVVKGGKPDPCPRCDGEGCEWCR